MGWYHTCGVSGHTPQTPGRLRVYALAAGSRPQRQAYARRLRKLQKPLDRRGMATCGRLMPAQAPKNLFLRIRKPGSGSGSTYVDPFDQRRPPIGETSRARMLNTKMFIETWNVIPFAFTKIDLETATWSPPGRIVGGGM